MFCVHYKCNLSVFCSHICKEVGIHTIHLHTLYVYVCIHYFLYRSMYWYSDVGVNMLGVWGGCREQVSSPICSMEHYSVVNVIRRTVWCSCEIHENIVSAVLIYRLPFQQNHSYNDSITEILNLLCACNCNKLLSFLFPEKRSVRCFSMHTTVT